VEKSYNEFILFNREGGGRGEKWTKPCMHIWIIKKKRKGGKSEGRKFVFIE
jgi:hypothetical protein